MHRTWLLSVSSKKLETCGSSSWKWIPPWSQLWGKLQWNCQQENKVRKRFMQTHVEKTFAQEAHTLLGKLHPFLGILISLWLSFPAWDHQAEPEAFIHLPHPHYPVKTQAWVVHLGRWPWVLDLKQDSSKWNTSKCIQCNLTAWRQWFQTRN